MKVRLIEHIGTRVALRIYWDIGPGESCQGYHNAMKRLEDLPLGVAPPKTDDPRAYTDPAQWPDRCDKCGVLVPAGYFLNRSEKGAPTYQVSRHKLYNTASGEPEPGDCYRAPWYHEEHKAHYCPWDNCNDPRGHLMVVLPNGDLWDTDSRASNCTMREDRTHRCWVKHGEPPNLHIDKAGHTCQAGGGSILSGNYHGFFHNGQLTDC